MLIRPRLAACLLALCGLTAAASSAFAETVQLKTTADAWISSVGDECLTNMGKAPRLKMKGYQEYGFFKFDAAPLKGKKIVDATFCVAPAEGAKYGKARGTDLRWFTVSTVSGDWNEGLGTNYSLDADGHGACFNQGKYGKAPWAFPGSKSWDVILGNGHTLRCDVDAGNPKDGWLFIPVDVKLVQALVADASHGLMLMDGSVFISTNAFIHSRDSEDPKKTPFLHVTVEDAEAPAPPAVADLIITPEPGDADFTTGAATFAFTVPEGAFAYHISVNGKPLPRWQIPFAAAAGTKQSFIVHYLEPNADLEVKVTAVNAQGVPGAEATATGKASNKVVVPDLPRMGWVPKGGTAPVIAQKLKVWPFPEISKLDPRSGEIMLEKHMTDADVRSTVWDGDAKVLRLPVAKGEIAGVNLALHALAGPVEGIKVRVEGLDGIETRQWRTWFVPGGGAWQADYAIPHGPDKALDIPAKDNGIEGQAAAVLALDFIVPAAAQTGKLEGSLIVDAGELGAQTLKVQLEIYPALIPEELNFIPELNCYRGPLGQAGSEEFFDAYRIAHYHRCTPNRVPHSHSGRTHGDWVPDVDKTGAVTDWSRWDKNLGPLLDGSAFQDNPRAGVPVPVLYLPFNESWPLPIGEYYRPGENVPLVGKDWHPLHNMLAKPVEDSFPQEYKDAMVRCVADFVKHFEEQGWTKTYAEAYNNNKVSYGKVPLFKDGEQVMQDGKPVMQPGMTGTAWILDEPNKLLDWRALKFYSDLFHDGIKDAKTTRFGYRGDISRPMWQGDFMDGRMEIMVAGGAQFGMFHLMRASKRRMPTQLWAYGSCNGVEKANHQTTLWCLKAYIHEADGILPWQSIGGDGAFDKGDTNGLIVDGKRFGVNAIASLRVHAMRQGAQLAELLRLLEKKKGWSRAYSAALLSQRVPLSAQFSQAFEDDAAALSFGEVNGDEFMRIKEGILKLLAE